MPSPLLSRRALLAAALPSDPYARVATPHKYGRLVVSASGLPGEFDARSVDCPFLFSHQGVFYMTHLGFDGVGYQTGLASSRDLVAWKREGCILRRDPAHPVIRHNVAMNWIVRENGLRSAARLKKVRGRYLGVYHAYPNAGYEEGPAVIGLCWSADFRQWEVGPPVLDPREGADWERGGLYKPCLVEHRGTFYLFYNAKNNAPRGWHEQTGVATSTDLKTWTRYEGNPILRNGGPGSPDERFASDPCVVQDAGDWFLFYFGLDAKGKARDLFAYGPDPFHFTKSDKVLIDVGPPGSVDEVYAHKPSVIFHRGALYHYYCAVSGKYPHETRGISVARSLPW